MVQTKHGSSEVVLPGSSRLAKHFKRMPLGRHSSDSEDSDVTFLGKDLAPSQQDNPTIWVTRAIWQKSLKKLENPLGKLGK